jgi:hypothetical protein
VRFFVICIAALFSASANAGALLMPEGQGQAIVTTTFADASKAYDSQGRLIQTPSYKKFEIAGYVEYGATDWLTVVAEAGAFDFDGSAPAFSSQPAPKYEGLGLGALSGRVPLGSFAGFSFSLQAGVRMASHDASMFLDLKTPLQADARLQAFRNFELYGIPCFLDTQFGYRSRGQNGDELRGDVTLGAHLRPDFMVLAQSFSAVAPWAATGNRYAEQKFALSGVYDLNSSFSFQLGVLAAPAGFDSPAERGLVTGLWARF